MRTTFTKQCEQVSSLGEALQKAIDDLRPQLGDLPNTTLMKIANEVTRGVPRVATPANPVNGPFERKSKKSGGGDPLTNLSESVLQIVQAAREGYQGKEFAVADLGLALNVGSRTLIPTFNSLERQGLFKKAGRGKRHGQGVNLYRLGAPLAS